MKNFKTKFIFVLVLVLVIAGVAFEEQIRRFVHLQGGFVITDVPLFNYTGRPEKIDENYRGWVVFYSDTTGCISCMQRLFNLANLDKIYDEVGFYAVCSKAEEGKAFADLMLQFNVPGVYLVDRLGLIQSGLGLSDRPVLMFFNRDGEMVSTLLMDIEHVSLKKHIHRLINEL